MQTSALRVLLLPALLAVLLLAGCANVDTPPDDDTSPLAGTFWRLTEYGAPGALQAPIAQYQPTLSIAESSLSGSTGCNTYGGEYEIDGTTITFGSLLQTERACIEEGVMQQESRYMELLRTAEAFALADNTLTLTAPDGVLVYTRGEPPRGTEGAPAGE
jgi:heat shock protein HslJ